MSKIEGLLRCAVCFDHDAPFNDAGIYYCDRCWMLYDGPDMTDDVPAVVREAAPEVEHEDDEPREVPDAA